MGDVKLSIAGRAYDVHCADGQEPQLLNLATVVDGKVRAMPGGTEVRQLLFAALMLAERVTDLYLVDERGYDGDALADYIREVHADGVVVMHNQVTLLSRAFNRDVWRDAAG